MATGGELVTAIIARLKDRLDDVEVIENTSMTEADGPIILIALVGWEPAEDAGTGQLCVDAEITASIYVSRADKSGDAIARHLAEAVMFEVYGAKDFGLADVGPASSISANIDDLDYLDAGNKAGGVAGWLVTWRHSVRLGESVWSGDLPRRRILFSWAPEIGGGHKAAYESLE